MKILITLLSPTHERLSGEFLYKNNYYLASKKNSGTVVEIKKSDKWLDQELSWVSKSEIPLITTIRHCQLPNDANDSPLALSATPLISEMAIVSKIISVNKFPSKKICKKLIKNYTTEIGVKEYKIWNKKISNKEFSDCFRKFDYKNKLLVRAGACIHKAFLLLDTGYCFGEDIYINHFIALEAIINHLMRKYKINRKKVIDAIGSLPSVNEFNDYEDEMRDSIRNNIIHPWRDKYNELVENPFLMADYIYEDLEFTDWLFKQVLCGKLDEIIKT